MDHTVVLSEAHLRRILGSYAAYYNQVRTHLSLSKDARSLVPFSASGKLPRFRSSEEYINTFASGFP